VPASEWASRPCDPAVSFVFEIFAGDQCLISGSIKADTTKVWVVSPNDAERSTIAKTVNGIAVRILQRADLVALTIRVQNWSKIVPYRVCSVRFTDRSLQREILTRLEKPHRLERLEAAFHPLDVNAVRSALFDLLAAGKVIAPEIDSAPLSLSTVFRRPTP
jgi:hypothetical protein